MKTHEHRANDQAGESQPLPAQGVVVPREPTDDIRRAIRDEVHPYCADNASWLVHGWAVAGRIYEKAVSVALTAAPPAPEASAVEQGNVHVAGASSGEHTEQEGAAAERDSDVVGHKTLTDGKGGHRHEPLTRGEADKWLAAADAAKAAREASMPDEQTALQAMWSAYQRLCELGWREAIYCPKDGSYFDAIEAGSTGVHDCCYMGEWPKGSWWVAADGDLWPSHPILFRPRTTPAAPRNGAPITRSSDEQTALSAVSQSLTSTAGEKEPVHQAGALPGSSEQAPSDSRGEA